MRVMFYAINGLGLGHVARLLAIARCVVQLCPNAKIMFLTSSEADSVVYREGYCAVKIPSKSAAATAGISRNGYCKLAQSIVWTTISSFDPDVLVVDTAIAGATDELVPVLGWPQKNVFVYREHRADTPDAELLRAVLPLYDLIVIPHTYSESTGPVPESGRVVQVGPILLRERSELLSREDARQRLGLELAGCYVLGTFGGGGDPLSGEATECARRAVELLNGIRFVSAKGPLDTAISHAMTEVQLVGLFPLILYLNAFDAAVASAGYNSYHELIYAGVPSVFVAMQRGLDDQQRRARDSQTRGESLYCEKLDPSAMAQLLQMSLDRSRMIRDNVRPKPCTFENGARSAAEHIISLL